ncbi:Receptor-like protein kinase ANXUR2 isoform C [Glycine soja]|nr:Receptor-like protein kinase ANXUR2 isoform C [Glycine soja]
MFIKYLSFCCSKHTSSSQRQYPTVIEELCHQFLLADLRKSTNNFDENQIVGSGVLSIVYKGSLQLNGVTECTVAMKRICGNTEETLKQFKNEIELLCQLRHPNLMTLLGFCDHKDEKIVVYEYMPNGSLHDRLYCSDVKKEPLTWKHRLKICIGAAHGLHYLHTGAKRTIFHRDITPYKILLDRNMVAKLSDFRLSLKGPHYASKPKPKTISKDGFIGTCGYVAPEISENKTLTEKCDVYSFGVVLLEVVCKDKLKNVDKRQKHPVEENIDPNIKGKIAPECWEVFIDITERCLKFDPDERPAMGKVEVQLELALSLQEEAGFLQHNGVTEDTVAMKRICGNTKKTLKQFKNEIELLCQLRHPNLITLLGFCDHKDEKIMVYEYMANGSLHDRLYCSDVKKEPLTWKHRLKICIGAAHGLHYLHTGAKRTIFHRDITPYKILLDRNMVAKLSDFRLSLKGPHYASKPKPKTISKDGFIGTCGYVAPEISENKTLTEKCDVYSFGVVLLEVVCKDKLKNVEKRQKHPVEENIDPNLKGKIAPECWEVFIDITERCLKFDPDERPAMGEVEVQLELALSLQEEADMRNSCDDYTLLSMTIIN